MKFAELLTTYHVPWHSEGSHCRPGWLQFKCPFCTGSRKDPSKPTMGYNIAKRYVNCWVCGRHKMMETVVALCRVDYRTAAHLLDQVPRSLTTDIKLPGRFTPPPGVGPLLPNHRDYLAGRGYDPDELVAVWGIGGIGLALRLKWRIYIPITYCGQTVSWTTRATSDEVSDRYISASEAEEALSLKEVLYGGDLTTHAAIAVEGPPDAWRIGPGAVALLGTAYTPAQVRRLARYNVRAVCFDNEPEAQRRARRLCDMLAPFPGTTYNVRLAASDPGEAMDDEICELRSRFLE